MATPATIEDFWRLVWKSGLVESHQLAAYGQKLRNDPEAPAVVHEFAERMIRDGYLTHFQASQILAGKWLGFTLGKYRLLERLGEGGMGAVYLAAHVQMRRRVALKILPPERSNDQGALERFYREARALAALDHPNIARAHDIDSEGKLLFLVMEYVDGSSLHNLVSQQGPLAIPRALNYLWQTALGLQHAHAAGLIHRDIKPSNLVVDRQGVVKILDLGLARFFTDQADNLTKDLDAKSILGTADYIAPEQAMDSHNADARADIYSLGCTAYYLLTGQTPFGDASSAQKLLWHQIRNPRPVQELRPELPKAVAAIIAKMMHKSANERFQAPQEVADALQPHSPKNVPPPTEAEMPELCPAASGTGMVDPHCAVTSSDEPPPPLRVASIPMAARAPATMSPAHRGATKAPAGNLPVSAAPSVTAVAADRPKQDRQLRSAKWWAAGMLVTALILGATAYFVVASLRTIAHVAAPSTPAQTNFAEFTRALMWEGGPHIFATAISADSRLAAFGGDNGPASTIRVFDVATGRQVSECRGHEGWISQLFFTPDGKLVSTCNDQTIRAWDPLTGNQLHRINVGEEYRSIAVAPDGRTVLICGQELRISELATGRLVCSLPDTPSQTGLFSPDGKRVLTFGDPMPLRLWDAQTGRLDLTLTETANGRGRFDITGQRVLAFQADGGVQLWDAKSGQRARQFADHPGVVGAKFLPDGQRLATWSFAKDKSLRVVDLATGQERCRWPLDAHGALLGDASTPGDSLLLISPDGTRYLTPHGDQSLALCELATGQLIRRFRPRGIVGLRALSWSPDGAVVTSGSFRSGAVFLYDLAKGASEPK